MAINISHPTNTIDGQDVLNLKSGNSENIELNPDSGLVNVNGDINITGNFRVQGTTTTVNSTTTSIVDPIIVLGTDEDGNPANINDGKDRGISFFYNDGSNKTGFFGFDVSNNDFRFIPDATINSEIVSGNNGTITISLLNSDHVSTTTLDVGNLNVTDNIVSSSISGNIVLDPGEDSIDVSNSNIINLAEPTNSQDAATKNYVDQKSNAISVLSIAGDFGTGSVDLENGTFTLNGTQYQIETTVSNDVITFSLPTNLIAPGSLEVTTNLVVNENTTTTTLDAGDLNITTNIISSDISGDIIIDSGSDKIQLIGDTDVTGNLDVSGNITLGGNITIGDQQVDTVNVVADFTSNLIPQADLTYNLGSSSKKWNNLYVGTVNGNVTGQVSDISNHTTDELAEGETSLYFTEQRVKDTLSSGTGLTYNDGIYSITNTGVTANTYGDASNIPVITINAQGQITSASTVSVAGVTDFQYDLANGNLTISTADGSFFVATVTLDPFTTDTLTEGENNLYYTSSRVLGELSAGTGVYYDSTNGVISIGQSVDTDSDVTFNSVTVTTNTTTDTLDAGNLNITTNVISSDVSGDIIIDSDADNIELIGNTNVTGDLNVSGMTYSDLTGNVTGQVSDISNHTTTDLAEGTNKYYTDTRARLAVSATDAGGDGSFSYDNTLGVFTYTGPSASETQAHFTAGTGLTYDAGEFSITNTGVTAGDYGNQSSIPVLTINAQGQVTSASTVAVAGVTDFTYDSSTADLTISTADGNEFVATINLNPFTTSNLVEGSRLYYLDSRARSAVSATKVSGFGDLTYNDANGVFSYTGPSNAEILNLLNAGTGVYFDYDTGTISIGQAVDTTSDVQFNNVDTVTLDAGNLNITTNVISSDVSGDIVIDSGADSIELIGDTNVTGNLSVTSDTIIYGNLTVQGTTTSINTTDTEITDNVLVLNQGETGAGVSKGTSGIEVARGSLFNASWKWNELTGRWEAKEGSNLTAIAVAEIDAGNLNIANNTIVPTDTNGDLNLNSNGTGQVLINGKQAATDTDALMYAIVFGG
jgi:hypothetical protein